MISTYPRHYPQALASWAIPPIFAAVITGALILAAGGLVVYRLREVQES
ncbi:MAG: hypothetical protein KKD28_09255 [Chloroflexi bacterium]|nr:hypothetical protein [Chloroflexota bacterium]MBU1661645.1 hypothetical protein [Chloroflexota bacterium]